MSLQVSTTGQTSPDGDLTPDYPQSDSHDIDYLDYIDEVLAFYERLNSATSIINQYCVPTLLFFGFATTLAMLLMTTRPRLLQYHYICIYLAGLASVNLLRLAFKAVQALAPHRLVHDMSPSTCKFVAYLYYIAVTHSHLLLLPVLLLDRCLATLRDFTTSSQGSVCRCAWVAALAARLCCPLGAKCCLAAVFVALGISNAWVWWTYDVDDRIGWCYSQLSNHTYQVAFSLIFWFLAALVIISGNVLIVVLRAMQRRSGNVPRATESQSDIQMTSTNQEAAATIVQGITLAFILSSIPRITLLMGYVYSFHFHYKTLNVLHLISRLVEDIYFIVIPVVFFVVLRREVAEEVRCIGSALWSRRPCRARGGGDLTVSINDLIGRVGQQ